MVPRPSNIDSVLAPHHAAAPTRGGAEIGPAPSVSALTAASAAARSKAMLPACTAEHTRGSAVKQGFEHMQGRVCMCSQLCGIVVLPVQDEPEVGETVLDLPACAPRTPCEPTQQLRVKRSAWLHFPHCPEWQTHGMHESLHMPFTVGGMCAPGRRPAWAEAAAARARASAAWLAPAAKARPGAAAAPGCGTRAAPPRLWGT